jgi:hypothetical protein
MSISSLPRHLAILIGILSLISLIPMLGLTADPSSQPQPPVFPERPAVDLDKLPSQVRGFQPKQQPAPPDGDTRRERGGFEFCGSSFEGAASFGGNRVIIAGKFTGHSSIDPLAPNSVPQGFLSGQHDTLNKASIIGSPTDCYGMTGPYPGMCGMSRWSCVGFSGCDQIGFIGQPTIYGWQFLGWPQQSPNAQKLGFNGQHGL